MYAHSLETLELPHKSDYTLQMWYDNSGERGGHPGIDIFYGQRYSEAQRARLKLYVHREGPPYPDWVYMYMWFIGVYAPYNRDVHPMYDFNLAKRVHRELYYLLNDYYKNQVSSSRLHPIRMLNVWSPPFDWACDATGMPFNVKLILRMHSFVLYPVLLTADEIRYDDNSGELVPERDKLYVYVDQSTTNSVCQWWVASMDDPEVCGWARPANFESKGVRAHLPRIAKPGD